MISVQLRKNLSQLLFSSFSLVWSFHFANAMTQAEFDANMHGKIVAVERQQQQEALSNLLIRSISRLDLNNLPANSSLTCESEALKIIGRYITSIELISLSDTNECLRLLTESGQKIAASLSYEDADEIKYLSLMRLKNAQDELEQVSLALGPDECSEK